MLECGAGANAAFNAIEGVPCSLLPGAPLVQAPSSGAQFVDGQSCSQIEFWRGGGGFQALASGNQVLARTAAAPLLSILLGHAISPMQMLDLAGKFLSGTWPWRRFGRRFVTMTSASLRGLRYLASASRDERFEFVAARGSALSVRHAQRFLRGALVIGQRTRCAFGFGVALMHGFGQCGSAISGKASQATASSSTRAGSAELSTNAARSDSAARFANNANDAAFKSRNHRALFRQWAQRQDTGPAHRDGRQRYGQCTPFRPRRVRHA